MPHLETHPAERKEIGSDVVRKCVEKDREKVPHASGITLSPFLEGAPLLRKKTSETRADTGQVPSGEFTSPNRSS